MGYGRALLQRDVKREESDLQKKATKKSLWSSIGRTAGSLAVMGLTGGAVNPVTLGLLTGGASFLGGAIGAKASKTGDLTKGKFFKSEREDLQTELGAFGTQNLTSSLKSGLQAGFGQAAKLYKSGETAAKGLDFQDSFAGKGWDKYVTQPKAVKAAGEQAKLTEYLGRMDEFATEFGEGGGIASERFQRSMPISTQKFSQQMPSIPEEQIGGVDPLGLKRMRVAEDISEFSTQTPIDLSFEFGEGGGKSDPFKRDISWGDALYDYRELFEKIGLKSGMSTVIGGK